VQAKTKLHEIDPAFGKIFVTIIKVFPDYLPMMKMTLARVMVSGGNAVSEAIE